MLRGNLVDIGKDVWRCGDVVVGKKLFLDSFVLDGFQHRRFWDNGFSFFFQCNEGIDVDMFNFPGNYITLAGQCLNIVGILKATRNKMVGYCGCGAVDGLL